MTEEVHTERLRCASAPPPRPNARPGPKGPSLLPSGRYAPILRRPPPVPAPLRCAALAIGPRLKMLRSGRPSVHRRVRTYTSAEQAGVQLHWHYSTSMSFAASLTAYRDALAASVSVCGRCVRHESTHCGLPGKCSSNELGSRALRAAQKSSSRSASGSGHSVGRTRRPWFASLGPTL